MYLVFYTLIGDGGLVREVHARSLQAATEAEARERIHRHFGEGYLHIIKVERVG